MAVRSKRVEQGNATRAELLRVALKLFAAHGYAETSLDAIVRAAGITKGAFYHHFSGKEEIFLRVFEMVKKELSSATFVTHREYISSLVSDTQESSGAPFRFTSEHDRDEVWRDLLERCRRYIELHTDAQVRRIVLVDARSVLKWDDWYKIENEYGVVILRANLRRAMVHGLIRPLPLVTLATMLAGALNEACMLVAHAEDPQKILDEATMIIGQLLEGIRMQGDSQSDA